MKNYLYLFFCLSLFIAPSIALASEPVINLNTLDLPDYIYAGTFDNLVVDFNINIDGADTLTDFTLKNHNNASNAIEIDKFVLYADDGDGIFEGYGFDTEIAQSVFRSSSYAWAFENLNYDLSIGENRFFITVETLRKGSTGRIFDLYFPIKYDGNGDSVYDIGDTGFFFGSNSVLSDSVLEYDETPKYKLISGDGWAPVILITNLANDQIISGDSYKFIGRTRDQGGSYASYVNICLDSVCESVDDTGAHFDTWEYSWENVTPGFHNVYAQTEDFNGNEASTEVFTMQFVQAVAPEVVFSATNSSVVTDKIIAKGDQVDPVRLDIVLKDSNNQPIANKIVRVSEVNDGLDIIIKTKYTDLNGQVSFKLRSAVPGLKSINVTTDEGDVIKQGLSLEFTEVALDLDYTEGRWLKLADQSAVYFLDENNIRHAYPNLAVWQSYFEDDFSFVETISVAEIANYALGRNVPFNSGALLKIPSVAKVYYVAQNGLIHWVTDEAIAVSLYGSNWAKLVKDLPESFFLDYSVGGDIE